MFATDSVDRAGTRADRGCAFLYYRTKNAGQLCRVNVSDYVPDRPRPIRFTHAIGF
jgi:hypothetical protein